MAGRIVTTLDACWKSIDAWDPLNDAFETQFRSDDELQQLNMSGMGIGDIGTKAAISLKQQPFDIKGTVTTSLSWPIVIRVEIWKNADQYRCTLDLLEQIIRGWFKAKTGVGPTVLEEAACGPPTQILGMTVDFTQLPFGQQPQPEQNYPVTYGTAAVVFQGNFSL